MTSIFIRDDKKLHDQSEIRFYFRIYIVENCIRWNYIISNGLDYQVWAESFQEVSIQGFSWQELL